MMVRENETEANYYLRALIERRDALSDGAEYLQTQALKLEGRIEYLQETAKEYARQSGIINDWIEGWQRSQPELQQEKK